MPPPPSRSLRNRRPEEPRSAASPAAVFGVRPDGAPIPLPEEEEEEEEEPSEADCDLDDVLDNALAFFFSLRPANSETP